MFLKFFLEHPDSGCQSLEPYINYVRENEKQIRECYEEQIDLPSDELSQLIVLDAVFLVQYYLFVGRTIIGDHPSRNTPPFPFLVNKIGALFENLTGDLIVQENQLPFFILNNIYDIAFGAVNPRHSFLDLTLVLLENMGYNNILCVVNAVGVGNKITNNAWSIKHLLHLLWLYYCLPFIERQASKEGRPLGKIRAASELAAVGVTITSIESDSLFDIIFDKDTGELMTRKLILEDGSELFLRNILIFEQFNCGGDSLYFFNYIYFIYQLVDSANDIKILQENGILDNNFGSNQETADLLNQLGKNLPNGGTNFIYSEVRYDLKNYASKPWNKWKAILWSNYFNHPWAIISVIAAIILLILTILQAITGFLQLRN